MPQPPLARVGCMEDELGEWVIPGQVEKVYPARFVWQMAVAISYETAERLQYRLRVPRSPALQHLVGHDRSW